MRENVWKNYNEKEKEELEKLCADYMQFLSAVRQSVNA